MAATASPPSEAALARFLAEASGADRVEMAGLELLAGGAIQENWGFDAEFAGGRLAGRQRLVLRTDAATGIPSSLGRVEEFAILRAAHAAGVAVPEPLFACANPDVIGKPFFVMRWLPGNALGRAITIDPALEPALPRIAARLGAELARIQTIRPPRADLGFLPSPYASGLEAPIAGFRAYLDRHPRSRPVLEWAIRWLETHIPARLPPVLCHRDFRTGNYMLDGVELTGILDWEFAGWGDPDEDIGWFCCKGWRFTRLDREAGGIADRAPFYQGYESASGRRLDPERVRFWEIFANVRWAVIALQQSDRYLIGGARDLSTAIIGRRATECELELLMLLDHAGSPASCRQAGSRRSGASPDADSASAACARGETPAVRDLMRDLPSGFDLVELGRDLLLDELLPLVPEPRQRELHLVATAIAIARREALAGDEPIREILGWLTEFYGCLPEDALLRRFAADLRNGAFATSQPRQRAARAILWRMTIAKLREGNPQFLAANGFA
jgi:aminoglycoside phosphotransferase (APT) family kinase protein